MGFNLYRSDRLSRRGGGLCIYAKKKLKCDPGMYSCLNECNPDIETQVLNIELPSSKHPRAVLTQQCHIFSSDSLLFQTEMR